LTIGLSGLHYGLLHTMSNTESNDNRIGQNSQDVDWPDIWRSANSGSGQTYTRPLPISQSTPVPSVHGTPVPSVHSTPIPSSPQSGSDSKVTLPPPSEKGWRWRCHDGRPDRYILEPSYTKDGNIITILVKHDEKGNTTLLAPVLPAWNNNEAAKWADPDLLSEAFARMSETIDKIDPATCFSVKTQEAENETTAGYPWWHVRALNTAVKASDYSFQSGGKHYTLRFGKAPTGGGVLTERYYLKPDKRTLIAKPPGNEHVLPTAQRNSLLAQLPISHPSCRSLETTN
jgi:hypothetical protein